MAARSLAVQPGSEPRLAGSGAAWSSCSRALPGIVFVTQWCSLDTPVLCIAVS